MQLIKKLVFTASVLTSICFIAPASQAAEFPGDRPITLIVPFAAGGPTDKVARELALVMGKQLKGQIIVENTPGAGGTISAGSKRWSYFINPSYWHVDRAGFI